MEPTAISSARHAIRRDGQASDLRAVGQRSEVQTPSFILTVVGSTVVLLGIVIVLGMLVDDAVVVVEERSSGRWGSA